MGPFTLHGRSNDWHVQKILAGANYAGVDVKLKEPLDQLAVESVAAMSVRYGRWRVWQDEHGGEWAMPVR